MGSVQFIKCDWLIIDRTSCIFMILTRCLSMIGSRMTAENLIGCRGNDFSWVHLLWLAEFLAYLTTLRGVLPNQDDLYGSAMALLRLQDVYALSTAQMARGIVQDQPTAPVMTGNHRSVQGCGSIHWRPHVRLKGRVQIIVASNLVKSVGMSTKLFTVYLHRNNYKQKSRILN